MANEFKIKKGLIVTGASGGTVVDIQGSQGQLFSVTDDLSGSIFAVSDISGVPIFDVNSSGLSTFDGPLTGTSATFSGDITLGDDLNFTTNGFADISNTGTGAMRFKPSSQTLALTLIGANATFAGNITMANAKILYTDDIRASTGPMAVGPTGEAALTLRTFSTTRLTIASDGDATFTEQAFSAATSSGDASSTLTTKGYVDGLITGATIYRGTWDPDVSLNSGYGNPDLSGVTQTSGYYYICSADGAATPNGTGNEPDSWNTGDWVIWNDDVGASGEWQKIDNSSVLSGVGTGQTVALWQGASSVTDSETLGNAPITVSGSDTTFAGQITGQDSSSVQLNLKRGSLGTDGNTSILFTQPLGDGYIGVDANGSFSYGIAANLASSKLKVDRSGNATFAGTGTFAGNVTLAKAVGDTELLIEADTNNNNENYNPRLHLRQDGGAVSAYFGLNGDADNTFTGALANGAYISATSSIQFANGSGTDLAMTIDTSQNVGIGTASPDAKLHIVGSQRIQGDTGSLTFLRTDNITQIGKIYDDSGFTIEGKSNNNLILRTKANTLGEGIKFQDSSSNNLMFIDGTNGNVGIGTTTPSEKLEVAGVIESPYLEYKPFVFYDFNSNTVSQWGTNNATLSTPSKSVTRFTTTGLDANLNRTFDGSGYNSPAIPGGQNQIIRIRYKWISGTGGSGEIFYKTAGHSYSGSYYKSYALNTDGEYHTLVLDMSNLNAGGTDWIDNDITAIRFDLINITPVVIDIDWIAVGGNGWGTQYFENDVAFMNGNVGIGTTSPGRPLTINSDSADKAIRILENDSANESWDIGVDVDGDLNFFNSADTSPSVTFLDNGNVGIGTDSPTQKLEVIGNISSGLSSTTTRTALIANTFGYSTSWKTLTLGSAGTNYQTDAVSLCFNVLLNQNSSGSFTGDGSELFFRNIAYFKTPNSNNDGYLNPLTFSNGNVAIGATSSTKKLTVNGSFKLGTNAYIEYGGVYPYTITTANTAAVGNLVFSAGLGSTAYESRIDLQGTNTAGVAGITLSTASTARMVVTADGDVGIGTTTPLAKLDIQGTQGQLFSVTDDLSGSIFAVADISGVPIFDVNSSGVSYFDGNVGIGTTSPDAKVEISQASSGLQYEALRLTNTADSGNMGAYISWHDSYSVDQMQLISRRDGAGNGSIFTFNQRISGALSPALVLKNGNVGIGTTNPNAKLHVNGSVHFGTDSAVINPTSGQLLLETTAGNSTSLLMYTYGASIFQIQSQGTTAQIGWGSSQPRTVNFTNSGAGSISVGIGTTSPSYELDVAGTIRATGDVIAYSDVRVKENIKTIDNSLEKVSKLRGVEFNKIGDNKKSIGVIAQEIEKVIPEVVKEDDKGMKSVAYGNISGLLIEAIKELKAEIEELKLNKCNCNK